VEEPRRRLTRPRPGHADIAGTLKYDRVDARDVLERASARETAARVAAGAVCRRLLAEFGVEIGSHVVALGGLEARAPEPLPVPLNPAADRSPVRCLDPEAERGMVARVDAARDAGDTLGGIAEVVARGLVVGLGSHVSWDRKLDGRLAGALMSIPAVKGVGIGLGFGAAMVPGSLAHDEIFRAGEGAGRLTGGFTRRTNRAGGLEGGITTGEPLVLRVAKKPIATLMSPLASVDLDTGESAKAQSERSDVTAVPAMAVIAEAMTAIVLAGAYVEKFGGDSLEELRRNFEGYVAQLAARRERWRPR
jgi:chorismate synthase